MLQTASQYQGPKPRLTVVSENYWPEHASTGQLITDLCEGLTAWFEVEVIAAQPRYHGSYARRPAREQRHGVAIQRLATTRFDKNGSLGRLANWASFLLALTPALLTRWRPRTYLFLTNPPMAPWAALLAQRQRQRSFVLVHDLYPDLAEALGVLQPAALRARAFERLNRLAFGAMAGVVALGDDMSQHLRAKLGPDAPITVIPSWADGELIQPRLKAESAFARGHDLVDKFVCLYAGNLGLFQDLETLIAATERAANDDLRLVFVGDGGKKALVQAAARRSRRVLHFDYLPYEQLGDLYAAADVGLIALEPGVANVNLPSKTYSILAAGRPFLAVAPDSRDLLELARQGCGVCVANDADEVAVALQALQAAPRGRQLMGQRARQLFEAQYDKPQALERFRALLSPAGGLAAEPRPAHLPEPAQEAA